MGEPGGDRKSKLQHWRTAQPTDGLPSMSPKGQPLKGRPQPPEDGTWGAPVPMQGINNRQGKRLGPMPKGSPPGVAVEGEAPGYSCSSRLELSILSPNRRQCPEGTAGESLQSAREMPPMVKSGAKASSTTENTES